jgi:hypothetical protein
MVVAVTSGTQTTTSRVTLPDNADTGAGQDAALTAVACPSATRCFAVGSYVDNFDKGQALVVRVTNGAAGPAAEVSLPAGAQGAVLNSLVCPSTAYCLAGGSYTNSGGGHEAMLVTVDNGAPPRASEVGLPAGALAGTYGGSRQDATIASVSCPTPGACIAVGSFVDGDGGSQAMVVRELPAA